MKTTKDSLSLCNYALTKTQTHQILYDRMYAKKENTPHFGYFIKYFKGMDMFPHKFWLKSLVFTECVCSHYMNVLSFSIIHQL